MKFKDPEVTRWWGSAEVYSLLVSPQETDSRLHHLGVSKRMIKELRWMHSKDLLLSKWRGKQVDSNPDASGWDF